MDVMVKMARFQIKQNVLNLKSTLWTLKNSLQIDDTVPLMNLGQHTILNF